MRKILALLMALWAVPAGAQIIGTLPFTLQNGSIADANQVMSDFNTIVAAVNANAASAGVNTNITALNGLTTPLVYTSGGTSNYIGGVSGGSGNAQTVASPIPGGFTLVTGKSITFLAGFTNTGATTLNVNSTGVTNIFRQGTSGPVALSGGEIVANNLVTVIFDGTQYQIANPSPQGVVPPCTVIDWDGANGAPSGYLLLNGQAVSRATFATLFACNAVQGVAATTTSGNASVVVPNSALFQVGWSVGGSNVTCNSQITGIPDGTHITLSATAGASGATTLTIGPHGQGDCSTTFNIGNFIGRAAVMRDSSGTVLSSATCTNPNTIGSPCGAQTSTLVGGNLPSGAVPSGTIVTTVTTAAGQSTGFTGGGATNAQVQNGTGNSGNNLNNMVTATATSTFTGSALGSSTPFSNLPPVALVDKYIKF